MMNVGILTISDKGSRGERMDSSGQTIRQMLATLEGQVVRYEIVPDEEDIIAHRLAEWADAGGLDLIVTTGGTGLAPRDVTPEATRRVIQRETPGLAETMRAEGRKSTPLASLSRGIAGARGRTLIVNLPGSPKAVRESLTAILDVLPHAVETLRGRVGDHAAAE